MFLELPVDGRSLNVMHAPHGSAWLHAHTGESILNPSLHRVEILTELSGT